MDHISYQCHVCKGFAVGFGERGQHLPAGWHWRAQYDNDEMMVTSKKAECGKCWKQLGNGE